MIKIKNIADGIPNMGYLLFSVISLIIFFVSLFFSYKRNILIIGDKASVIFMYSTIGLIIKNGKFDKSNFYKLFLLSISFLLIGTIFKIQHINYSIEIIIFALFSALLAYFLYFLKKINKSILDYSKLVYFLSLITLKIIAISHYLHFNVFWWTNFICGALVVTFIYYKNKNISNWLNQ